MDIWSLGAVYSETLVWSVWGKDGRDTYTTTRKNESNSIMKQVGYGGCFHNGTSRLDSVDHQHRMIIAHIDNSGGPSICKHVSNIISKEMLLPKDERRTALHVYNQWCNRERSPDPQDLDTATGQIDLGQPTRRRLPSGIDSGQTPHPGDSPGETGNPPFGASETIQSLWEYLHRRRHQKLNLLRQARFQSDYAWIGDELVCNGRPTQFVSTHPDESWLPKTNV